MSQPFVDRDNVDDDINDLGRVRNLVRAVQEAVEIAWRNWTTNNTVQSIDLTLKTVIDEGGGAAPSLKVPLVEFVGMDNVQLGGGLNYKEVATQEVKVVLTPRRKPGAALEFDVRDAIAEAVNVIKQVMEELRLSNEYGLEKAIITLDFVVTTTGSIKVLFFNFERKHELAHKLVITVD